VAKAGARMRERPYATSSTKILRIASVGEALSVIGKCVQPDGVWYQVKLAGGGTGFMRSDQTSAPKPPAPR
jgi:hypothetical protein